MRDLELIAIDIEGFVTVVIDLSRVRVARVARVVVREHYNNVAIWNSKPMTKVSVKEDKGEQHGSEGYLLRVRYIPMGLEVWR